MFALNPLQKYSNLVSLNWAIKFAKSEHLRQLDDVLDVLIMKQSMELFSPSYWTSVLVRNIFPTNLLFSYLIVGTNFCLPNVIRLCFLQALILANLNQPRISSPSSIQSQTMWFRSTSHLPSPWLAPTTKEINHLTWPSSMIRSLLSATMPCLMDRSSDFALQARKICCAGIAFVV